MTPADDGAAAVRRDSTVREVTTTMWAATTRTIDGRVHLNALGDSHDETKERAGKCGPDLLIQPVVVGVTTCLGARHMRLG